MTVEIYANPSIGTGIAGVNVDAGEVVYYDTNSNTYLLAIAGTTQAASAAAGIALGGSAAGQPITFQTAGDISLDITIDIGTAYYLDTTAGQISAEPATSGDYPCLMGMGTQDGVLRIGIITNDGTPIS